jgi:hypothetical protein
MCGKYGAKSDSHACVDNLLRQLNEEEDRVMFLQLRIREALDALAVQCPHTKPRSLFACAGCMQDAMMRAVAALSGNQ